MSGTKPATQLPAARERADAARARFNGAWQAMRGRMTPARLKADAVDAVSERVEGAKENARTAVREHPVLTASAAIGGLALLFWKPARLVLLYGTRGAWIIGLNRMLWRERDDK